MQQRTYIFLILQKMLVQDHVLHTIEIRICSYTTDHTDTIYYWEICCSKINFKILQYKSTHIMQ
jgi:hypothetical protein